MGRSGFRDKFRCFLSSRDARDQLLEKLMLLGAKLLDDVGKEVLHGLSLGFSSDDESVVLN